MILGFFLIILLSRILKKAHLHCWFCLKYCTHSIQGGTSPEVAQNLYSFKFKHWLWIQAHVGRFINNCQKGFYIMSYLREKLQKLLTVSCWDIGSSWDHSSSCLLQKNYIVSSFNKSSHRLYDTKTV